MMRITNIRYLITEAPKAVTNAPKTVKPNMKQVKIDFPLPTQVRGIEKRLNTKNTFIIPK